ncbi:MAG: DoxX family membrane protein [Bacteroidetes bacterium]|nr:DoxX family membrane protein [Bacteroidota bacterium]MBK8659201.1 DoxX family membrane protein [Bacteroidota bacterium]
MELFQRVKVWLMENTVLFFRIILALTFSGHGLVSLGFSPGYELHYRIFSAVNYFDFPAELALKALGVFDLSMALCCLFGIALRYSLALAIFYLLMVAGAGWVFFNHKTGLVFGFAESFRRFAWIFYALFLWIYTFRGKKYYTLLRMGIAFAFLAHGLASLGLFGLKGGHIELASQILSEDVANKMVFYSGYTDTLLGSLLLIGFFSRQAATIGALWLVVVVVLSFMIAVPDGIFRTGFLLSCVYVAVDSRCHDKGIIYYITTLFKSQK